VQRLTGLCDPCRELARDPVRACQQRVVLTASLAAPGHGPARAHNFALQRHHSGPGSPRSSSNAARAAARSSSDPDPVEQLPHRLLDPPCILDQIHSIAEDAGPPGCRDRRLDMQPVQRQKRRTPPTLFFQKRDRLRSRLPARHHKILQRPPKALSIAFSKWAGTRS
jgi:hypothetical protein